MDLELDDEQEALRATVRRCLADLAPITPYVRGHVDGAPWQPDDAGRALAELGATGVLVPSADGGLGLGLVEVAILAEEAGRALYPGPWAASAVGAVVALREAPQGDAAAALLAAIAAGTAIAAAVVPEPIEARPAIRLVDGALSGEATGVLGAASATVLLVAATAGDAIELVAVDADSPGVRVELEESIDRTRDVATATFDGATGTPLGALNPEAVRRVADALLVAVAADGLGAAQAVMDLAVAYAKERRQFDQPIGAFQAVQHLCVDMLETVELARGGVVHAAWCLDAGDPGAHVAALRLKAFADRLATVGDTAIQVFGGIGFTWEHDSHLYLKRLLTWSAYLGAPAAYRREVGRTVVAGLG